MTRQCCQCRRVALGGEWILPAGVEEDNVTHTYCPPCLSEVQQAIDERQKTKHIIALARSGAYAT